MKIGNEVVLRKGVGKGSYISGITILEAMVFVEPLVIMEKEQRVYKLSNGYLYPSGALTYADKSLRNKRKGRRRYGGTTNV